MYRDSGSRANSSLNRKRWTADVRTSTQILGADKIYFRASLWACFAASTLEQIPGVSAKRQISVRNLYAQWRRAILRPHSRRLRHWESRRIKNDQERSRINQSRTRPIVGAMIQKAALRAVAYGSWGRKCATAHRTLAGSSLKKTLSSSSGCDTFNLHENDASDSIICEIITRCMETMRHSHRDMYRSLATGDETIEKKSFEMFIRQRELKGTPHRQRPWT